MPSITWTPDAEAKLTELWKRGLTAGQISEKLGFSRSSICSKARRLNLPARKSPIQPRTADQVKPNKKQVFASVLAASAGTKFDGSIAVCASRVGLCPDTGYSIFEEMCRDLGAEQCV